MAFEPFKPNERVLFYGDSITHGGRYIFYLQLFENLRHPGSGVRFMNGGRSGGTARDGLRNFERELKASRPDRAVVMFGMNDINRSHWKDETPDAKDAAARAKALSDLRMNMTKLVGTFMQAGIKPALMTPTPFDQYNPKAGENIPFCNEPGVASAAEIVREIIASNGLDFVELHRPMTKLFKDGAEDFVFCRDRVHPAEEGHLYIAALILDALGASPEVGGAVFAASPDQDRVSFDYAPEALPFPRMPEYETIAAFYPFTERFNREIIRIDGLGPGRYTLAFDGRAVGEYSSDELAKGVNVALLDTPNQRRAQALVPVMRRLQRVVAQYRNVVLVRRMIEDANVDPQDAAAADRWLDAWLEEAKKGPWYLGQKAWADGFRAGRAREAETLAEIESLYARLAAVRPAAATVTATRVVERDPAAAEWETRRRGEALDWFAAHQFGRTPIGRTDDETFGPTYVSFPGLGVRIDVSLHLPEGADAEHPVPVFLFGDHSDVPGTPDFARGFYKGMPIREITSRGYAFVRWNFNDVCPNASRWNKPEKWPVGVIAKLATGDAAATNVVRRADSWGTIGAWAWGNSRVMDWIESRPELDAAHVAVVGHSRGGKAALWTGAQDRRFAMVVANGSGCGGAGLARERVKHDGCERFRDILGSFPNWFCPAFAEWIGREAEVPHDADDLIRLIAPRLVYVASGDGDRWACPAAEKAALDAARDLYRAYGAEDRTGYHCHHGPHKLHAEDWAKFMDFADRHWRGGGRPAEGASAFEATVRGRGEAEFRLSDGGSLRFSLSYPDRGPNGGGVQLDEHQYIAYSDRVRRMKAKKPMPPHTPVSNCVVRLSAPRLMKDVQLYLLPYFHSSYGLYSHDDVVRNLSFWKSVYPLADERTYELAFEPDPARNRTTVYLDGSVLAVTNALLDVVSVATGRGLGLVSSGKGRRRAADGMHLLPKLAGPSRASGLLKDGATLSIEPGDRVVGGVPMRVWAVGESIDQGVHHRTSSRRGLCSDPQYDRKPWQTGYEYLQWRIPGGAWSHAWVLCADVPQEGREPVVGVQLSKLGQGCTGGNINAASATLEGAREVGTLTYGGGRTAPLRLVRVDLDSARLGARGNGQNSLDFEFTGGGAMGSSTRSSVQVFGCTLVEAPYTFEVDNPVRGNIFEQGTDAQACGFKVTANVAGMRGSVDYEIYGPLFEPLATGTLAFSAGARGETTTVGLDLSGYGVGWYGMDFVFRDAAGKALFRHEASFTVLAPDTREAGYESPYAAWPHSNGYHGSNPDPMGPRTVMRKAGYRNSWEPPVASEEEGRPWKIGLSTLGYRCCQPGSPSKTRAEFEARLDRQVELVRRQAEAFPHAQVIMLLHEQGGRQISREVATGAPGVRGEYRGWDFDAPVPEDWAKEGRWEVFYCTEWAKRLRREFPGKKIMIGNGSSSCEKIASLVRRGFDLDLVDQLGIESKGFGTMPEFCANQESPGMLWALRETGRAFGYTNFTLNACNEYVFRTERSVDRAWPRRRIMSVTDFTLRDYLISMAHGCTIISTGHLEDAADAYYDTNWGAGGQCKAYPWSYPKRMFTALAVLTRVIDCPQFLRRVPTGDNTAIVFEFRRNRRTPDYAYALWTPTHETEVELGFPADARVVLTETFGAEGVFATNRMVIGSSPRYLVSSKPMEFAKALGAVSARPPDDAHEVFRPAAENLVALDEPAEDLRGYWGLPAATNGSFRVRTAKDAQLGEVFEAELVRDERRIPAVVLEARNYGLANPVKLRLSELRGFGLWIRGNGSYGKVKLILSKPSGGGFYEIECGERGYVTFGGWQYVDMDLSAWTPSCGWLRGADEVTLEKIQIAEPRLALDPLEMRPTSGAIAIGPVYALPKTGEAKVTVEELQSRRAWENTKDRDR